MQVQFKFKYNFPDFTRVGGGCLAEMLRYKGENNICSSIFVVYLMFDVMFSFGFSLFIDLFYSSFRFIIVNDHFFKRLLRNNLACEQLHTLKTPFLFF